MSFYSVPPLSSSLLPFAFSRVHRLYVGFPHPRCLSIGLPIPCCTIFGSALFSPATRSLGLLFFCCLSTGLLVVYCLSKGLLGFFYLFIGVIRFCCLSTGLLRISATSGYASLRYLRVRFSLLPQGFLENTKAQKKHKTKKKPKNTFSLAIPVS
jgi:hypothetical protein